MKTKKKDNSRKEEEKRAEEVKGSLFPVDWTFLPSEVSRDETFNCQDSGRHLVPLHLMTDLISRYYYNGVNLARPRETCLTKFSTKSWLPRGQLRDAYSPVDIFNIYFTYFYIDFYRWARQMVR